MNSVRIREIPDEILERCATIWCHHIRTFSRIDIEVDELIREYDTPAIVEHAKRVELCNSFKHALLELLIFGRDNHGLRVRPGRSPRYNFPLILSTTSHADGLLASLAESIGIPGNWFPPDTYTAVTETYVETGWGKNAPKFHYPISRGWLVCSLSGADMPKIINAVEQGRLPELTVKRRGA